jgi:hypothetical protein
MVFMCERCAKKREYAIAGRLNHISVISTHGFDHQGQRRVDDGARFLGIEVLGESMMSTKRAVTSLRSPSGIKLASAARLTATREPLSGRSELVETAAPQALQKRDPGGHIWPQREHSVASASPQWLQNRAVASFSASHFAHLMIDIAPPHTS